tara:strand:+ start:3236 stop:3556 length:321 start_codon:yes stop_codon:yes gene_type:complete
MTIETTNPLLEKEVDTDSELKEWLVNYVGEKKSPEDEKITVEMIVDVVANEFPDFLMVVAEENWIRGYHQALADVDEGQKIAGELESGDNEEATEDSDVEEDGNEI